MAEIKYIPVSKLWRHPDNPRKDLGDVTELAESIKVNGVLQNLTVVPLIGEITKKWDGESYRVIIGHRRLAAAKLAGLEELPCVVVEMSEREQLKQERKDAAEKALSEATARAYELRADFVATVSTAAIKKRLADIVALWAYAEYWDDTGWLTEEEIAQATGAETLAEDDEDGEDDAAFTLQAVTDAIGKTPEKALLRMIYARLGDGKSEGYFRSYWNSYPMEHEENEKLDRIYALLVKLGYEMSDDEKALQDGTHALFGEATDE